MYRVKFKIAMLAHVCIYGNAPEYFKDPIKVKGTTKYNLRSDGEMLLEDGSARSKKTVCFAFRPQPALPRKLDSVNLVPRGYFRLYKRPRGIRQRKD